MDKPKVKNGKDISRKIQTKESECDYSNTRQCRLFDKNMGICHKCKSVS